jgi:hypothetical protein
LQMKLHLEFDQSQAPVHRTRMDYAFRCFCAIYEHTPVPKADAVSADAWISYSDRSSAPTHLVLLQLPNLYSPRPAHIAAPRPQSIHMSGSALTVIHGNLHGKADWLGEIFEWLSCADEYSVAERDSVGRVPFKNTLIGRNFLDPLIPRAAVAMQYLQKSLTQATGQIERPGNGKSHYVVNTHDVDFLSCSRSWTSYRLAKNSLISCVNGSPSLGGTQAISALRTAFGGTATFLSPQSLADSEIQRGVSASYYFLVAHSHRRDGNYQVSDPDVLKLLEYLRRAGMEVGIHGSYTCLDEPNGLATQYRILSCLGFTAQGGRQHWLRLSIDRLIDAVQRAHARYDASLGWTDKLGFRAGACFAFPPYDFSNERPANFLELPLVISDCALASVGNASLATQIAHQILKSSRQSWGGFSVLWHPASFRGAQLPAWVGDSFWTMMDIGTQEGDVWLSAEKFLEKAHEHYVAAGLLSSEGAHAHQ